MQRALGCGASWRLAAFVLGAALLIGLRGNADEPASDPAPEKPAAAPMPVEVPPAAPPIAPLPPAVAVPAQPAIQLLPAPVAIPGIPVFQGPFGPAPQGFGNENLPAPPPRRDPFANPEDAENDRVSSQEQALSMLEESRSHAQYMMRQESGIDSVLGALALLELNHNQPEIGVCTVQCLERIVAFDWSRRPRETAKQMIRRRLSGNGEEAENENELRRGRRQWNPQTRLVELKTAYEETAGAPWPLDWRVREDHWIGVIAEFVQAADSGDPIAFWKKRISADAEKADWSRACFLATIRIREEAEVDLEPVAGWLDAKQPATQANLLRVGEVYRVVVARRLAVDAPQRKQVHEVFTAILEKVPLDDEVFGHPLGDIVTEICQSDPSDCEEVLEVVLRAKSPQMYRDWSTAMGQSRGTVHQKFLARKLTVDYRDQPLDDVLRDLAKKVVLPLWIDDEIRADKTRVTLAGEGAWIDLVDQVLEKTPYKLQRLRLEVLWIGKPERRRAAESFLADSIASTVADNGDGATPLVDPIDLDVKSEPVRAALAKATEELSSSPLIWLGEGAEPAITCSYHDLPACLVLAFVARDLKVELANVGGMVVLGPSEKLARLQTRYESYLRRRVLLSKRSDEWSKTLCEASSFDLSQQALDTILSSMNRPENSYIALAVDARKKVNPFRELHYAYLNNATPAWGLELIGLEFGLEWDCDEHGLFFFDPATMKQVRARMANREARREKYPDDLATTLGTPVQDSFQDRPLAELCKEWSQTVGANLECDPQIAQRTASGIFVDAPLDASLDTIAAALDVDWHIAGEKIVLRPRGAKP